MKLTRGFTLIELLVVISIIGLLSSLAVVSLGTARNKAYDAKIKSDLNHLRTQAALYAEPLGIYDGFSATPEAIRFIAPVCSTANLVYGSSTSGYYWAAWAKLCANPSACFCVDSSGNARETTVNMASYASSSCPIN